MKLTKEQKNKIIDEIEMFKNEQYANLTKAERQKLGQFFTPGPLVVKMVEKFHDLNDDILDPTCGSGNLLLGCIIAGADPKRCYGIELDAAQAELCRTRLQKYGVPRENIITGDALNTETYEKLLKKLNDAHKYVVKATMKDHHQTIVKLTDKEQR